MSSFVSSASQPSVPLRRADGSPIRVLVVDDEHSLTDLLKMALRYERWEIRTADTGRGALDIAREFRQSRSVEGCRASGRPKGRVTAKRRSS